MPLSFFERCKRLLSRSSGLSVERAEQVERWKKTLIDEHAELSRELNELLEVYERSLNCFAEHAADLDEASFQRERRSLEDIRQILANAIRRLELSTKDNQELVNEWNEWRAQLSFVSQDRLEEIHRVRLEMLRSELAVRGLKQEKGERKEVVEPPPRTRVEEVLEPRQPAREPDHLDDWHEMSMKRVIPISEYWSEQIRRLQDQHHPEAWPEIIRQFRAAQAALKLHDRLHGIRRDRVVVFER